MFNPIKYICKMIHDRNKRIAIGKRREKLVYWVDYVLSLHCKDIDLTLSQSLRFDIDEIYEDQHRHLVKDIVKLIEDGAEKSSIIKYLEDSVDDVFGYEPEYPDSIEKASKQIFELIKEKNI